MWAQLVYHRVRTIYAPVVREWSKLPDEWALPVFITRSGNTMALCKDPIIEETCADTSFLTSKGVESACLFCVHSLTCSINKRKRGHLFTPEDNMTGVQWNDDLIEMLTNTTEIPLLALYPNLREKLNGKPFEIEFIAEIYEMDFNRDRILSNLGILSEANRSTLMKYQSIAMFSDVENFRKDIRWLAEKIQRLGPDEYNEAISTLKL